MTPENQKTLQELKKLKVNVYRGLHLNARNTDMAVVDQWIDQHSLSPSDLERLLNHMHINEFFPDIQNMPELQALAELERLANELVHDWKRVLSGLDVQYKVEKYEDYGPVITFHLDRGISGTD